MKAICKDIVREMANCNLNYTQVSKKLYMSRSCVWYHIEKIKTETGLDCRNFYDLVQLIKMVEED